MKKHYQLAGRGDMLRPALQCASMLLPVRASFTLMFIPQLTIRSSDRARSRYGWLPLALIHILFAGVAFGQDKSVSVETIERAKYAAVPIVCLVVSPDGTPQLFGTAGSAFFINEDGYFVTAAHVLAEVSNRQKSERGCLPAIYLPKGGWAINKPNRNYQWFAFTECLQNVENDVAVCRPKENPFQHPEIKSEVRFVTFASSSAHADGTAVAFTGFPLNLVKPVTSKVNIASYLPFENLIMIDANQELKVKSKHATASLP